MTTAHKAAKPVDFNHEYRAVESLILSLWAGFDNDNAKAAMRFMFNQGLRDAKFWVDRYITQSLMSLVSHDTPYCILMEFRIEAAKNDGVYSDPASAAMHDTLFIFDRAFSDGLTLLADSYCERGWDFTKKVQKNINTIIKQFSKIDISPKFMKKKDEDEILQRYDGIEAQYVGAPSTPDRLTIDFVTYSRDEQGLTLIYSIFSVIYSHALFCSKLKNGEDMLETMLPIYRHYNGPIKMDNGEELLEQALKNPLFAIINKVNPVKFLSSAIYLEKEEKRKKYMAETTAEERAANRKKLRESIAERALNAHRSPAQAEETRQAEERVFNHIADIINNQGSTMPDANV